MRSEDVPRAITSIFSLGLILITARSVSLSRATMLARYFLLSAVVAEPGFTALIRVPLAEVRHIHWQETSQIGTRMTHRIEIRGPLSWLYGWSLGRRLREGLAPGMRALARLAS